MIEMPAEDQERQPSPNSMLTSRAYCRVRDMKAVMVVVRPVKNLYLAA
ncbi:MAG: hypothetical protein MZV63_21760 [Marinilabiliales bacterium]|nr:hypothetical protein [Marinilabiliales bacterium]